jgi:lysophospholipase L1-like esterase
MRVRGNADGWAGPALAGIATLLIALFWAYLLVNDREPEPFVPPSAGGPASAAPSLDGARAAFVGDGFTAPTATGGAGPAGYPGLVAAHFGWQPSIFANDGAGYVTPGAFGLMVPATSADVAASNPDVVVAFAGRADVGRADPEAIASAAAGMFQQLRDRFPAARLVAVGPVATDAVAPAGATDVRDALANRLGAVPGVTFVDPLAEGWFTDAPAGAIGPDGQHPTDIGHQVIAERLEADLTRLGIARPAAA